MAVVALDDDVGRRQSEARPALLGREVGIENARQNIGRNADAVVADDDAHVTSGRERRMIGGTARDVVGNDGDMSAGGHGLVGVEQHVAEHLRDLPLVRLDPPQIRGQVQVGADLRAGEREAGGLARQTGNRQHAFHRRTAFCESEELGREAASARHGLLRLAQWLSQGFACLTPLADKRDVPEDGAQQVVEVVGDAAGEQPERIDALRPQQFLLGTAALRDVAADAEDPYRPAFRVADHAGVHLRGEGRAVLAQHLVLDAVDRAFLDYAAHLREGPHPVPRRDPVGPGPLVGEVLLRRQEAVHFGRAAVGEQQSPLEVRDGDAVGRGLDQAAVERLAFRQHAAASHPDSAWHGLRRGSSFHRRLDRSDRSAGRPRLAFSQLHVPPDISYSLQP
jgi:hypothetical protein